MCGLNFIPPMLVFASHNMAERSTAHNMAERSPAGGPDAKSNGSGLGL